MPFRGGLTVEAAKIKLHHSLTGITLFRCYLAVFLIGNFDTVIQRAGSWPIERAVAVQNNVDIGGFVTNIQLCFGGRTAAVSICSCQGPQKASRFGKGYCEGLPCHPGIAGWRVALYLRRSA